MLAEQAVIDCDLLFSIGTSSLVWPAVKLPDIAKMHGGKIIQIDPDSTPLDSKADYNPLGKVGQILPTLVSALSVYG
jgi:NAD-dependent deacetylase